MIRLLNLGPAKHEKVAIYAVNQRISNVCRIAGAALQRSNSQRSNSQASVGGKRPFAPNIIMIKTQKTPQRQVFSPVTAVFFCEWKLLI